ncbi:MAG: sensor histidine kinase, partial [Chloroflexota bacterium]
DLSHMIVHDLRTPLTVILTSLSLLQRLSPEKRVENQERVIERTTRAAERLDKMIDDILLVSKIEKGELELRKKTVRLSNLLSQQLDPYYLQARAEEKTLELRCPPELEASLDPRLTGRVLENLVSNAFKYTMAGGHISVTARGSNGSLSMSVADDGEGIPDEYKEAIFRKFSQAPGRTGAPARKGTGLGLAFCRLAIEAHGGKIWVVDAPGGGSEFRIELPREEALPQRHYERTIEDSAP